MLRLPRKPAKARVPKSPNRLEYEGIRAALVATRTEAGLTQVELAGRLKRSQGHVSEVERGIKRIDPLQVWDWCHACGTNLEAWGRLAEQCIREAQEQAR
jgi:transcriptional regulator with XRE-family HTH domain